MVTLGHLEQAYASGLRALGPAHYGPGTYAPGTDESGPLGQAGPDLLRAMERLGIILDVTHLSDESLDQAMDLFSGTVWASHCNCRALVPGDRQLSDEQLKRVIERDGVIGAAFDAWMLIPGWKRGETTPESSGVCLSHVVDHIDYVCQLAGNAKHACLGTDLDGGFGLEQSPGDMDSIAGLQKLPAMLSGRGYSRKISPASWRERDRPAAPRLVVGFARGFVAVCLSCRAFDERAGETKRSPTTQRDGRNLTPMGRASGQAVVSRTDRHLAGFLPFSWQFHSGVRRTHSFTRG